MKRTISFISGVLVGAMLLPGAIAAAGIIAERSTQPIYVDGQRVRMEAYTIAGSNYVKLRDIGKEVGFNVSWDEATRSVQIDSDAPYADDTAASAPAQAMSQPQEILENVPDVGDRIICDDGYVYEIIDMSRYDTNVFASGPVGELPEPTCDWSAFPKLTLPRMEKRHFKTATGDDLFVRNMKETRRMEYTLYNALGREPSAWRDGKPLATVSFSIPADMEMYAAAFWPWDETNITDLVHSCPNSRYFIEAWDCYHNGRFMYVRYIILSL